MLPERIAIISFFMIEGYDCKPSAFKFLFVAPSYERIMHRGTVQWYGEKVATFTLLSTYYKTEDKLKVHSTTVIYMSSSF